VRQNEPIVPGSDVENDNEHHGLEIRTCGSYSRGPGFRSMSGYWCY
jgi:hypothetical protein